MSFYTNNPQLIRINTILQFSKIAKINIYINY